MTAIALVLLFSPGSTVPSGPEHADKVTHALIFLGLAVTSRHARITAGHTVAWLACFAVVTEILQSLLPINRSGSVWDVAADLVGVVLGLVAARYVGRHSQSW